MLQFPFKTYVPVNDIVAKSPVYVARNFWNNLPSVVRSIVNYDLFKNTMRKNINNEYVSAEIERLTAGLFR